MLRAAGIHNSTALALVQHAVIEAYFISGKPKCAPVKGTQVEQPGASSAETCMSEAAISGSTARVTSDVASNGTTLCLFASVPQACAARTVLFAGQAKFTYS